MLSGSATMIINMLVVAAGYPVYLHFLGLEKYGVWLVLTTVLSFASLGNLGMGPAVMKLVAEDYGRRDISGVQSYVTTALAILLGSGSMILLVILFFKNPIVSAFKLDKENAQMVSWLLPYIGALCVYSFLVQVLEAALSGLGRMDWSNYIRTFSHAVQVGVAALLLACGLDVKAMLISSCVSCIFIHILTLLGIRKIVKLPILEIGNINRHQFKRLIRFGGTVFSGTLVGMLVTPFNNLILARYAGVNTLPVYEIAYRTSMYIRSIIETGMRALLPEISRVGSQTTQQAKRQITNIYNRTMKLILKYGTPTYVFFLFLAPFIFPIWLGERYVETMATAFQIMLLGSYLSLLGVPAYYTLMGMNRVTNCLVSHVLQSGFNVIVVIALVFFLSMIQVQQIALAVTLGMGISTLYLIKKTRVLIGAIND